ncbi:centrosomal protein of 112 kDa-like [Porites lutea]|uniref:centrosomal protein of 112 kDa-like n=1 Tax=Porites lutea TaxID=51062 RepID=UPI003CC59180
MTSHRYGEITGLNSSLSERQDSMFDRYLEEMKPFVLRLPHKSERQRVALWIKKLCEPPGPGTSGRKNRNLYAQLLLHMVKRGLLEDPFTRRPEAGPLQPLPSYMSIYLDEPVSRKSATVELEEEFGHQPPDWLREIASSSGSIYSDTSGSIPLHPRRELPTTNGVNPIPQPRSTTYSTSREEKNGYEVAPGLDQVLEEKQYKGRHSVGYPSEDILESRYGGRISPPPRRSPSEYQHTDSGYPSTSPPSKTNHYNGFTKGLSSINGTFRDDHSFSRSSDREIELRTKMVEAKYHEDKLKLQQQHDVAVQKILDRKNMELEEVKSHYRNKITEMEAAAKKQERKVSQLVREAQTMKEQRDQQIAELKTLAEQSGETAQHGFEKKLNDKIAEFEQEKFEMQKQHTQNIQELLDETNQRLQKMETEYNQQNAATRLVIQELETRVQQLTQESEGLQSSRSKLAKEKEELEQQASSLSSELQEAKTTLAKMERDHSSAINEHKAVIKQLNKKTDASMEGMKQQHAGAIAKATDTIAELESQVTQLKQALQDTEFQRQRQLRELEAAHKQEKLNLEHLHEKKIRGIQAELNQGEEESEKRIRKLEAALKERDDQVQKLSEVQKQQAQQAELALEDFKSQVERNSGRMFDEMKAQMEKVEEDLARSKNLREKQAKEFSRQLDDLKIKHEKEVAEISIRHEQEKAQTLRAHQIERDSLLKEHEQGKEMQLEKLRQKMLEHENQARNRTTKDAKTIAELEQQVRELREEIIQANSTHKTQLMELSLMREEEKQNYKRQEENMQVKFKSQLEQQKLQLQREHSTEMEQILEKTNNRMKQMEEEYVGRSTKGQKVIETLEDEIKKLKEEIARTKTSLEKKLAQTTAKHEDEKASVKKHHSTVVKSLQQDVETQKTMVKHLEKRVQQTELDSQERISRLRLQYEEKMKGLMPASLREELEDTIESLRQQISVLQSRARVLQEELDSGNRLSSSFSISAVRDQDEL